MGCINRFGSCRKIASYQVMEKEIQITLILQLMYVDVGRYLDWRVGVFYYLCIAAIDSILSYKLVGGSFLDVLTT